MKLIERLDMYLIEKKKEYLYKAAGEVMSIFANNKKAALAKIRKEWGLPEVDVKIIER